MRSTSSPRRSAFALLSIATLAALFAAGCGITPPSSPRPHASTSTPGSPQRVLHQPGAAPPVTATGPAWYTVAQKWVYPLRDARVAGSRYDVHFLPGSLTAPINARIEEYDPRIVDFQLGPHGTQFLVPVTVSIDYSGTNADPSSPAYDGSLPVLLWLNPSTHLWEIVVGVDDRLTHHYTVVLTHFSRYAMSSPSGGTGEW